METTRKSGRPKPARGFPRRKAWTAAGGLWAFPGFLLLAAAQVDESKLPPAATNHMDFVRDIKPILETSCLRCHGPEKPKSNFRLDNRVAALRGGDNGVDILPGQSAQSPLIHYTAYAVADLEMPPPDKGEPLTPAQIGRLRAWIDQGAAWDSGASSNNFAASISPALGGTMVSGDAHKFRELNGRQDGVNGGLAQFDLWDRSTPDTTVAVSGHALLDDYKLSLAVDRTGLGFIHSGWEQYRKYYDDVGGYYPAFSPAAPALGRDLYVDIGKAWVDFGLTLPHGPRLVLGYEYDYRNGDEATLDWGAFRQPAGRPTRNILPASEEIHEGTQVIKFDLDAEVQDVTMEDRFRGEFYNLQTSRTNETSKPAGGSPDPSAYLSEKVKEGTTYFQGANTVRLERKFTDWLFASGGYLYSKLNADSSFNRVIAPQPPPAGGTFQWTVPQITLEQESHVLNLNGLLGPFQGLTFSGGVQSDWTRQRGLGAGTVNEVTPTTIVDPASLSSDYDETSLEESLALRYGKIPYTSLFAEARWQQESIGQFDRLRFVRPVSPVNSDRSDFLQNTEFFSQLNDLRAGFNTSPWRAVSWSAHYRHYEDDSHYDNAPLQNPIGSATTGYPGFLRARDETTDEIETRLVLRLCSRLKTTLSYQVLTTDYSEATGAIPGVTPGGNILAGRDHSQIYALNAVLTPTARLYLGATFSWQPSTSGTAASASSTAIVPYRGVVYSVLANATYVLNQTTDLFADYAFSTADYGGNNFAAGLPVGISYAEHGLQIGVARRVGKSISAKLQYTFNDYDEPGNGGASNFRAQAIFATLTCQWP